MRTASPPASVVAFASPTASIVTLLRKIDLHNASHVGHNPTPSLEKLRALADGAYQDRKQRMANAWRRPV
jgi:hypothetical protein